MGTKSVVFIGFLVSALYISWVLSFNKELLKKPKDSKEIKEEKVKKESMKFLLHLKDRHIDIISKLPNKFNNLEMAIDSLCLKNSCTKDMVVDKNVNSNLEIIELLKRYIKYIKEANLSKASIIVDGNNVEINFLVRSKAWLEILYSLKKDISENINIVDNSSVLEIYDLENFQKEINSLLSKYKITYKNNKLTNLSIKLLDEIFNRLKVLGELKIDLEMDINKKEQDRLKNFILKRYPFILDVEVKSSKKNKIKIKEIL